MGGGKKSKHKNLYKEKKNTVTNAQGGVKWKVMQEGATHTSAFNVEHLEKPVSLGHANASAKSEVMTVDNFGEGSTETSGWDESESLSPATDDVKKTKSDLASGNTKGKDKKHGNRGVWKQYSNPDQHLHDSTVYKGQNDWRYNKPRQGSSVFDRKSSDHVTERSVDENMKFSNLPSHGAYATICKNQNNEQDNKPRQDSSFRDQMPPQHVKEDLVEEDMKFSTWGEVKTTQDSNDVQVNTKKNTYGWGRNEDTSGKMRAQERNFDQNQYKETRGNDRNTRRETNRSQYVRQSETSYDVTRYGSRKYNYEERSGQSDSSFRNQQRGGRSSSFGSTDRDHSRGNSISREFDYWNKKLRDCAKDEGTNVNERFGDIFCAPNEYALGHCVAEDMNMGSGIATHFRRNFKRVDELLQQRVSQGGVAVLHIDDRYIYYLVTKRQSNGKPTYLTLFRSLCAMKEHMVKNEVQKLALPRIGCGLDNLEWTFVKSMLQYIFRDVNTEITVYNFQEGSAPSVPTQPSRKCPVRNVLKPVVDIEEQTIILYPCSAKQHISSEMEALDKRFNIIKAYQNAKRDLGSVIRVDYRQGLYVIYGVVVQENPEDMLNYRHFQNCIAEINKVNKKEKYEYVAMQGFEERRDTLTISKLVNLMRNTFFNVYVYICWPTELAYLAPRDIDYS